MSRKQNTAETFFVSAAIYSPVIIRYNFHHVHYAETVRHLKAAGLIVLLVLDENTAKDETLKTLDGFYANWQIDGITVKDAIDFVKKKSAFTVQSVHDGNYI